MDGTLVLAQDNQGTRHGSMHSDFLAPVLAKLHRRQALTWTTLEPPWVP